MLIRPWQVCLKVKPYHQCIIRCADAFFGRAVVWGRADCSRCDCRVRMGHSGAWTGVGTPLKCLKSNARLI